MLFLSMLAVGVQPVPTPSTLIKLDDPYAVCIDGSPATYYWSKGANATAFLFHHQGGGWCQTTEECSQRAQTALGSSTSYPATKDLRTVDAPPTTPGGAAGTNHFNRDPLQNPLFHDWNYVYMPYCDGNSFAGDAVASAGGKVLNFRGTKIRESVVAHLKSNNGFAAAEHVVVSGCSAGGAATFFHTDWFAEQAPGAKVRGMPDSGWFLNGDYARDGKPDYGSRMENMHSMANTSSGLPTACTAAGLGYKCLFAPNLIQFLKTPIFAINSKFDASMAPGTYNNKMGEVMGDYQCPEWYKMDGKGCNTSSVNAFGDWVTTSMQAAMRSPHGAYLHSCYRHCGQATNQLSGHGVGSLTPLFAFKLWYEGGSAALPNNGFLDQAMAFPCTSCCFTPK